MRFPGRVPPAQSDCLGGGHVVDLNRFFDLPTHHNQQGVSAMFDLVRKSMLAGVGLALKAWDEVEDLAKEVAEQGKMTENEGRKFIEELQDRYEEAQKKLEARVEESVRKILKKADVVTQDELKALKKEIRDLKQLINSQRDEEKA
jgi:polyhydroxyalkanoate synthesis regulator phasin